MKIQTLATSSGDSVFYTESFRINLESHFEYLLNHPETRIIPIDSFGSYKFEGDLTGYLDTLRIARHYHWPIMLLNRMRSNNDLEKDRQFLILPSFTQLDMIANVQKSKN